MNLIPGRQYGQLPLYGLCTPLYCTISAHDTSSGIYNTSTMDTCGRFRVARNLSTTRDRHRGGRHGMTSSFDRSLSIDDLSADTLSTCCPRSCLFQGVCHALPVVHTPCDDNDKDLFQPLMNFLALPKLETIWSLPRKPSSVWN